MLKNNRIKVLHVLAGGNIGGAQRFVEWFIHSANQKDIIHEVVFLYHGGIVQLNLEKKGVMVSVLNWKNGYSILGRWRLIKFISSCNPDIIQFHDATPLVKIFIKCFFWFKPVFQLCHGIQQKSWLVQMGRKVDDKFIDFVICNSEYTLTTYGKTFQRTQRMQKVHLGLAMDKYGVSALANPVSRPLNKERNFIVIIFIGRLQDYKGVLDLPTLALHLKTLGIEEFRIHVVGDGPAHERVMSLTKSLGVEKEIIFCGAQENVLPFLMKADIFVFPSWGDEAFGLAPLEALACGLSVVAYNSGAVSEVIGKAPGVSIVEKKNVMEMAVAIADVVKKNKFPDISECIAFLEENFNIDRTVFEIEKLYKESIRKR